MEPVLPCQPVIAVNFTCSNLGPSLFRSPCWDSSCPAWRRDNGPETSAVAELLAQSWTRLGRGHMNTQLTSLAFPERVTPFASSFALNLSKLVYCYPVHSAFWQKHGTYETRRKRQLDCSSLGSRTLLTETDGIQRETRAFRKSEQATPFSLTSSSFAGSPLVH